VAPGAVSIDSYQVATKLAEDAVVAYHGALQFHGKAYSVSRRFHYLTRRRARPLTFRGLEFVPVQASRRLRDLADLGGGILERPHAGGVVRVTTLERTLVDVLNAPDKGGGWEEIWRSLEMVEFFDLDAVIDYARKLGSAVTCARVGFFLEQHGEALMVEDMHLARLKELSPREPRYFDSKRLPGKFVHAWNLVIPEQVLRRAWGEVL
jgi:predicted transcriptional regulator of viral defense system